MFAALNVLDGTVVGRCMPKHTHKEFIKFLNAVERAVPAGKVIHAIADNCATHKHPKVMKWLADHPRWTFHFTPTSASWLNAVEGFFSTITRRKIRRGVFKSVADLILGDHSVPLGQRAVLLKLREAPRELNHAASHAGVPSFSQALLSAFFCHSRPASR